MSAPDEFYIGYERGMPPRTRRAVTGAVTLAAVVTTVAALVFTSQQRGLADSRFEFGQVRSFEGYLSLTPAPALLVADSGQTRLYWLVATGKFGPGVALGGARPGWVTLSGTLIERDPWRMIEVVAGSIRPHWSRAAPPSLSLPSPRRVAIRGEIVDSKCYLGVMNPGERVVHRDCAVRCLAGGVPAMFAYQDSAGSHLALLVGGDPRLRQIAVGRPITLSGVLSGPEASLVFSVDAAH